MSEQAQPAPESAGDDPIGSFSDCHRGIVSRLDELAGLPPQILAAQRARHSAKDLVRFFDQVIEHHHRDEERELFPAVLRHAAPGDEKDQVRQLVDRLTADHLSLESQWARLRPHLRTFTQGDEVRLDEEAVRRLVADYKAHAALEEEQLLPLASTILGRNDSDLAALGMTLHLRHGKRRRAELP